MGIRYITDDPYLVNLQNEPNNNITTAAVAALTNIQAVQLPLQELSSHHRMHINYYPVTFTLWNNYCPWLRLRSRSTSF